MARRDREPERSDEDDLEQDREPPESPQRERRRSRLEGVIPELIKKAVGAGYNTATGSADALKQFIADSKLPKEIANAIFEQIDQTKNGLFRVVAREIRGFLEAIDWQHEMQKLLTTVSFEIKTEIRFIPNDSAPDKLGRPQVNAAMKVKRQRDKNDKGDKRRAPEPEPAAEESSSGEPVDETPPPPPTRIDTPRPRSNPPVTKSVPPPAGPRESNRPPPPSSIRPEDDEPEFP
jgi:hypothetical protein